jgi:hypothetical protein
MHMPSRLLVRGFLTLKHRDSPIVLASKCDDISCSEVIRALNLDDDPELEAIEERISQHARETREWKHKKAEAEQTAKSTVAQLFYVNGADRTSI